MASSSTAVVAYGNPVDTTRCMHCRARSYSSTLMELHRQDRSSSNSISGRFSSSSLPSMAASCSSAETQESEGYFSFQSVGLLEPEEVVQQTQKDSRDDQYKDGRSRKSQQQHVTQSSKKLHVRHASRSNSLSRLFSAFASSSSSSDNTMPLQKKKSARTRAAHPFSSSASSLKRSSTPVIFEGSTKPNRPSLLDTVKMKSDPYIDIERMKCERQHRSYYEGRCEMGFLVNAETSLRDVL